MDAAEIEESLFVVGDAKLHGGMCKILSLIVYKVLEIFPFIEASRPRSKSGIQALCSLHVALDKAKTLLKHCSDCSKLYLAITGESILLKFEKTRCTLQDSLRRVEDIVPQAIGCKILDIVSELEAIVFELDEVEKQVGNHVITLLQKERLENSDTSFNGEIEVFHQAALRLGITSSRAALTERRALKKLIERAQVDTDKRKELIVSYLLHLMRKYSKLFRSEVGDDTDSQGSAPCSPTLLNSFEYLPSVGGQGRTFERHISKLAYSFNSNGTTRSRNMATPPEELRCPISLQLMYDPVIIASGQTYERAFIEKWFCDGHSSCPKTQQQLAHLSLTPNYCVKGLIASWCEQNGIPIPDSPPESLNVHHWRLASSESEATDSRSLGSLDSCMMRGVKVVPLEETGIANNYSCEDFDAEGLGRYVNLLGVLYEDRGMRKQRRVVEQIRFLLKDDEEARIYMGANGAVDALVHFLRLAIDAGDEKAQETGAMALFNLSVNNNRNKGLLISSGVIPLLEQMIANSMTEESAAALYLNLSSVDEAKPLIGSSPAVPFLVQLVHSEDSNEQSKHDALYTLFNLSMHPANIQSLLNSGIVTALQPVLTTFSSENDSLAWVEKAMMVLLNLAASKTGCKEMVSTAGLISALAVVLDVGELPVQEQAVSCLLILCTADERCTQMVLQEGVIPALVSVSANGTTRGREKAQRLLKLFREQRQREPEAEREEDEGENVGRNVVVVVDRKPLCKTKSKFGRTLSCMWRKNFSLYQC